MLISDISLNSFSGVFATSFFPCEIIASSKITHTFTLFDDALPLPSKLNS